ncbi:MAG: hypothetical protein IPM53_23705 [Anaerolineaceae bacterium]|nr:hypothetical protein [Anaerolineaceae bacterium]
MNRKWSWNGAKGIAVTVASVIFPLDEELELLHGQYTPQIQEALTRLGSKMPFAQAVEEIWFGEKIHIEESVLRQTTYRHGQAAEAIERAKVERLETKMTPASARPKQILVSADGAFIHLTNGEWREVKTMVVGEFARVWNGKKGEIEVKTGDISYFSRSYRIREFERYALAELHRRGVDNAEQVVTVNDGSEWIQSFADYHLPQAVRILDFRHALDYVVAAGQAVYSENSDAFRRWYQPLPHQLKHKPPRCTIAELCLLTTKAESDDQLAIIDHARRYLQRRAEMIDYPHFQNQGYPIGSGSVESSHKGVVHSRMKQAGMRWAESHVDPMLTLRNWVCNGRWSEGWSQVASYYWQQQRQEFQELGRRQRPTSPPITFADVTVRETPVVKEDLPVVAPQENPPAYKPAADHPWRRDIWPTREAWRWN